MDVARWRNNLARISPRTIDVGLAVAVAVAVTIAILVAREPGARPVDAISYALGLTVAALVVVRRRWPLGVLAASFVVMQAYFVLDYPGISAAVALAVAMYTAVAAGHLRWSLLVAAWFWFGFFVGRAFLSEPEPLASILDDLLRDGTLLIAVLLLGETVRSRRLTRQSQEQELRVAQQIQQRFLPKEFPRLSGWQVSAYYQPAHAVGGDFYDLLELPDGEVGLWVGDVTDKGIPAALIMATTQSILRGDAAKLASPSDVLERANNRLYSDTPAHMFVTCLYAILHPATGRLRFANAGHNLPYVVGSEGVVQLRARGMPLGAMPDMEYEEKEARLDYGSSVLFLSDGLVEAHNPAREMFGLSRVEEAVENSSRSGRLIDECLAELKSFVGRDWEQEDDITLVTLRRTIAPAST
jgi:serine phosphatase RsbU (regulator of sigma subunit)